MSRENESKKDGLCVTCVNVDACVYYLIRGGDVIYCNMFEDGSGKNRPGDGSLDTRSTGMEASNDQDGSEFEGLCANCATRHTCTKSHPVGGVWHCEDYC